MTDYKVIVCGIITNAQGQILLCRRSPDKKLGGYWEFPGGKLEHGEELIPALRRELQEELGIQIDNEELLLAKPHVYPHGAVLILFYLCRHVSGDIQLVDHDACKWVTKSELNQESGLLPANAEINSLLKDLPSLAA